MYWLPVLLMRWATLAAEFLGEITKETHSARIIPSVVVAYVSVSGRQGAWGQRDEMEEDGGKFFTRVS